MVSSWSRRPAGFLVRKEEEGDRGGKRAYFPAKSVPLRAILDAPPNNSNEAVFVPVTKEAGNAVFELDM